MPRSFYWRDKKMKFSIEYYPLGLRNSDIRGMHLTLIEKTRILVLTGQYTSACLCKNLHR